MAKTSPPTGGASGKTKTGTSWLLLLVGVIVLYFAGEAIYNWATGTKPSPPPTAGAGTPTPAPFESKPSGPPSDKGLVVFTDDPTHAAGGLLVFRGNGSKQPSAFEQSIAPQQIVVRPEHGSLSRTRVNIPVGYYLNWSGTAGHKLLVWYDSCDKPIVDYNLPGEYHPLPSTQWVDISSGTEKEEIVSISFDPPKNTLH